MSLDAARATVKNGTVEKTSNAQTSAAQSLTFVTPNGDRCIDVSNAKGDASIATFMPKKTK